MTRINQVIMWRELAFMLDQLDSNCPKLGTTEFAIKRKSNRPNVSYVKTRGAKQLRRAWLPEIIGDPEDPHGDNGHNETDDRQESPMSSTAMEGSTIEGHPNIRLLRVGGNCHSPEQPWSGNLERSEIMTEMPENRPIFSFFPNALSTLPQTKGSEVFVGQASRKKWCQFNFQDKIELTPFHSFHSIPFPVGVAAIGTGSAARRRSTARSPRKSGQRSPPRGAERNRRREAVFQQLDMKAHPDARPWGRRPAALKTFPKVCKPGEHRAAPLARGKRRQAQR
jgi:hypothetical protein